MQDPTLVLRDIHQPPAPPWWPPAPGWWGVAAAVLLVMAIRAFWRHRRRVRRRAIAMVFDEALAAADTLPAQVAAMSELLRRAGRRRDARADRLDGEAWLEFLDAGDPHQRFRQGAGRLLLEGGYRREVDPQDVAALRTLARERFLGWMAK